MEGDRFARKQRDEAFLNGRLVVDLADHAEQVTHVVVRGDGEFHAVGGALGLGRERVGRGIELLREDFGRVVDHAGEGIVGRHGNDEFVVRIAEVDNLLVQREALVAGGVEFHVVDLLRGEHVAVEVDAVDRPGALVRLVRVVEHDELEVIGVDLHTHPAVGLAVLLRGARLDRGQTRCEEVAGGIPDRLAVAVEVDGRHAECACGCESYGCDLLDLHGSSSHCGMLSLAMTLP